MSVVENPGNTLASLIAAKRKAEGLSLRDAGKAADVAFSTLGRVEAGAEPSYRVARKIEAWLAGQAPQPLVPLPPMTLRDWFAGQALAGFAAQCDSTGMWSWLPQDAVREAYSLADAMLATRTGSAEQ